MFHRSWGILMIQKNISAPTTVLDFPTREAFAAELRANHYDIVGISSIIVNVGKVREMCRMVRELSPRVHDRGRRARGRHPGDREDGGCRPHCARRRHRLDAPVSWARTRPRPSAIPTSSRASARAPWASSCRRPRGPPRRPSFPRWAAPWAATSAPPRPSSAARAGTSTSTIPARNCSTSCARWKASSEVKSFFMMDENFLLHKRRAMELLDLMKAGHKAWSLYVFSSANAISQYTMRELVELGVSWIWMGLESPRSAYTKLNGADTHHAHRGTAQARHQAAGLHDRRAGAPHAGEHRSGDRARGRARHRFPPVHAVHAGARHAALLRDEGAGPHAARRQPGRHPRPARVQLSRTRRFRARTPSTGWTAPSGAISSATVPAFIASAAPRWTASGVTRTTPIRGCASASPARRAR